MQLEFRHLNEDLRQVIFEIQRLRDEIRHMKDDQIRDKENLLLRIENEMLHL